jgi:hypothetical protein
MAAKKNADGLVGQSPIDPSISEVVPGRPGGTEMQLSGPGGTPVRATHPGLISEVLKVDNSYTVRILAAGTLLNNFLGVPVNLLPFTEYKGLGGVEVASGEKVSVGQQIGTLAFQPTADGPGGVIGFTYKVFASGSGNPSAERNPQSEAGIALVVEAQVRGETPTEGELLREAPPEASVGAPGLNAAAGADEVNNPATLDNTGTSNFPYRSRPQVKFVEQKNQVFNHDFLLYINGVDVTQYVVDNLSVNIVDKDGWNEANFALNNAQNNFVISLENLGFNKDLEGSFRSSNIPGESKYSEFAKREIIRYKQDEKRNPFVNVAQMQLQGAGVTQGVATVGAKEGRHVDRITANTQPGYISDQGASNQRDGKRNEMLTAPDDGDLTDRRWQLGFQSAVFHKHDPIRIFRKNPLREADEWMPAFTGYLNQISYNTNYINGMSVVSISCYDIRAMAANMRVQETSVIALVNPRALFQGTDAQGSASLFTDLINPTSTGNPLQARRFEDVMEFIITGASEEESALNSAFGDSGFRRGIGDFTVGERINYNPGDSSKGILPDPLEHWHALCLFGTDGRVFRTGKVQPATTTADNINPVDSRSTATKRGDWKKGLENPFDRRFLTEVEARTIGANTTHDGEWSPHKQFVHFLLPAEGTGARNLLSADVANVSSNQLDFRSRLDIMQDFAARIDYQFWVSPMGDFIVEFPQYDFFPEDYGEYKTVFQVDKHLKSDVIQDEAGDMTTVVVAHGRIRPEGEANAPEPIQPKAIVVSPMMMMRYGVIEHELTLPFISSTESLARIAVIEFQKRLAASNKMDMEFDYRPFILPNRPIEHMERKRMGLTTAVQNGITVFGAGSSNITTRYVRRQIFRKDGRPAYLFISSGTSMPITYREIYESGTIVPVTGAAGAVNLKVLDSTGKPVSASNTGQPANPNSTVTANNHSTVAEAYGTATPGRSPTPPPEQVGIFMALGQQLSGWNPLNRTEEGGLGMFNLSKDARDSLGIGDTTDVNLQTIAADGYWRDLVEKYKGDYKKASGEFVMGVEKIKNIELVEEFEKGFYSITEKLGKEYENAKQSVVDGWDLLFPGEAEPVDEQLAEQSEESRKAAEAAEEIGPTASGRGFRTTQGVLVFKRGVDTSNRSNKAGAVPTQAEKNKLVNENKAAD